LEVFRWLRRGWVLISFDEEMAEKARAVVKVHTNKDLEVKPTF
jgi:hypothetical protein